MKKILFILFYICIVTSIFAHPHMQILSRAEFTFKNNELTGVWLEWEFDLFFSADIIISYDYDKNGIFDYQEIDAIYNEAFISLKDFNYFTFIRVKDKRMSPTEVQDFTAHTNNKKNLIYRFFVPLSNLESNDFYLSIYDFTYFCACFYQDENPVIFSGTMNLKPYYSIQKNEKYPVYYDPYAGPDSDIVYKKWEEGLETIVIKEIHVKF